MTDFALYGHYTINNRTRIEDYQGIMEKPGAFLLRFYSLVNPMVFTVDYPCCR